MEQLWRPSFRPPRLRPLEGNPSLRGSLWFDWVGVVRNSGPLSSNGAALLTELISAQDGITVASKTRANQESVGETSRLVTAATFRSNASAVLHSLALLMQIMRLRFATAGLPVKLSGSCGSI